MVDHPVHRAHRVHLLGGIGLPQEEDLASELLADLPREIGAAVAAVEASDVGVGLFEAGVLTTGQVRSQTTCELWPPPAAHRSPRQITGLGHEPDQPLHLRMCSLPARAASTVSAVPVVGVLVAGAAADALIASRAERPAAIPGRGPVAGQQHHADVRRHPRVVQRAVELVDGVRPKALRTSGRLNATRTVGCATPSRTCR